MHVFKTIRLRIITIFLLFFCTNALTAQKNTSPIKVIAFYTAKEDPAHISFVYEANKWFSKLGEEYHFIYDSTNDWNNLNKNFLTQHKLVLFLDTRPDSIPQRKAFEQYMKSGGVWMGFHFSAFALTASGYPQNWDWYQIQFFRLWRVCKQHLAANLGNTSCRK